MKALIDRILAAEALIDGAAGERVPLPFGVAVVTVGLPRWWLGNQVFDVHVPAGMEVGEMHRHAAAVYGSRGATCFIWNMRADANGSAIASYLSGLGYRRRVNRFYRLARAVDSGGSEARMEIVPARGMVAEYRQFYSEMIASEGREDADELAQSVAGYEKQFAHRGVECFFAMEGGAAMGAVRVLVHGDMGYISDLDVLPAHRRKGVGRALLWRGIEALRGSVKITLFTAGDNVPAIRLYEGQGFELVGESSAFYVK